MEKISQYFGNKSENSVNFPQIYEIFPLFVGKSMLPMDVGQIYRYFLQCSFKIHFIDIHLRFILRKISKKSVHFL